MDATTQTKAPAKPYRYRTTTAARMAKLGNFTPCTLSAETLFDSLPEDGSVEVRWQGFGSVGGVERFSTQRLRRSADGQSVVVLRAAPAPPLATWRLSSATLSERAAPCEPSAAPHRRETDHG